MLFEEIRKLAVELERGRDHRPHFEASTFNNWFPECLDIVLDLFASAIYKSAAMENDHEIALRLRWRHTWEDKENDFLAEADGYQGSVGRIYQHDTGGHLNGNWFWAMNAHGHEISRNIEPLSGYEPSPRRAAREVERAWFAAIRGSSLEVTGPEPTKNAYAAAKARE